MVLTNLKVTLILIYAIPSIILYIFIIILVLKRIRAKMEPFTSHFYKLFVINGCFDLIRWITVYWEIRVDQVTWFFWFYEMMKNKGFLLTFMVWLLYYSFYGQVTTFFFITLNRFTAIVFLLDHKQFWKRLFTISVVIIFLIPLPFTWHLIATGGIIYKDNISDPSSAYSFDAVIPGIPELRNSLYESIFCCVAAITGLFMNLSVVISLWKHRKSTANVQESSTKDSEVKLFVFAVLLFAVLVCEMVVQLEFRLRLAYMSDDEFYSFYEFHVYFTDFLCLSPPWTLLLLSRATREEFLRAIHFHNPFISSSNSAVTPINWINRV